MIDLFESIYRIGIVPVAVLPSPDCAVPMAAALREGGIPCAEVTFRTAGAAEAIAAIRAAEPEVLVGAGTVLSVLQAKEAIDAGAQFLVSPGFCPEVVEYASRCGVPMLPGVATPSEVELAMSYGLDTVKFFPAEAAGGAAYLKALNGPYKQMKFLPTGGVNADNLKDYLALPNVIACGGSWMLPSALLKNGDYAGITKLCREAVANMLSFKLDHVGISAPDADSASAGANALADLLGLAVERDGAASVFNAGVVEWMKGVGRGERGHIAFSVSNIHRAVDWLRRRGVEIIPETYVKNAAGKYGAVYLKGEFCGFTVHLVEK